MLSMLNLLPSEAGDKLSQALSEWESKGSMAIYEPCDCGSQIRHNNGGNYHQEIYLRRDDSERVFVKFDDTCGLTDDEPWQVSSESEARDIIARYSDWL